MMQDYWQEITMLEKRMDDAVRGVLGARVPLAFPTLPLFVRKPFAPAMNVFRRNDDLVIRTKLPGIDPEKDVRITTHDHELVIEGERRQEEKVEEVAYYRMEAAYETFERRPDPRRCRRRQDGRDVHGRGTRGGGSGRGG